MPEVRSIREWRDRRAYSLKDLADLAHIDPNTLWRWEIGKSRPMPANKRKLASALGISVEQIAWGEFAVPKSRAA